MPQKKLVIDTDAYLRLAHELHPLLFNEFGSEKYCIYCIKELETEYDKSSRLQSKFHWVNEDEYFQNRKRQLSVSKKQSKELDSTFDFLWQHSIRNYPGGPSQTDVKVLAHASVIKIHAITDDQNAKLLAKDFGIKTLSSLELLKLMLDCNYIQIEKVRSIVLYWSFNKDLPNKSFRTDYQKLFNESAPV